MRAFRPKNASGTLALQSLWKYKLFSGEYKAFLPQPNLKLS
jgi:hypothetical protein